MSMHSHNSHVLLSVSIALPTHSEPLVLHLPCMRNFVLTLPFVSGTGRKEREPKGIQTDVQQALPLQYQPQSTLHFHQSFPPSGTEQWCRSTWKEWQLTKETLNGIFKWRTGVINWFFWLAKYSHWLLLLFGFVLGLILVVVSVPRFNGTPLWSESPKPSQVCNWSPFVCEF